MIEVMEISQEEKEMILKNRANKERKQEIDECITIIKQALDRIKELKGTVRAKRGDGPYKSCSVCLTTLDSKNLYVWY